MMTILTMMTRTMKIDGVFAPDLILCRRPRGDDERDTGRAARAAFGN